MEAPVEVTTRLKAIKPTFRLVYNPMGRVVGERSFDVVGRAREKEYEPRWELWDKDESGVEYRMMVIEKHRERDGFLPVGYDLVDFVNLINPARYGGDVGKMVEALVDAENDYAAMLSEQSFKDLVDYMGDDYWEQRKTKVSMARPFN